MKLIAPVSGIVIYGDSDRRGRSIEPKEGMDVRHKEVLLTIPDMSKMVVGFNIPEHYRSKLKIGDMAMVTPDSIPGLKIKGRIETIDSLPVLLIPWDAGSPKVYVASIEFDNEDPRIVSGMNAQVEIVSKVLEDIICVPVEAVFEDGGRFFVYVHRHGGHKEVDVEIGQSNDNFVEIKKGLSEGEEVFLYRPFQSSKGN